MMPEVNVNNDICIYIALYVMIKRVSTYIKYKEIIITIMINKESICYYLLKAIK